MYVITCCSFACTDAFDWLIRSVPMRLTAARDNTNTPSPNSMGIIWVGKRIPIAIYFFLQTIAQYLIKSLINQYAISVRNSVQNHS
jgi:hypothetical protein